MSSAYNTDTTFDLFCYVSLGGGVQKKTVGSAPLVGAISYCKEAGPEGKCDVSRPSGLRMPEYKVRPKGSFDLQENAMDPKVSIAQYQHTSDWVAMRPVMLLFTASLVTLRHITGIAIYSIIP